MAHKSTNLCRHFVSVSIITKYITVIYLLILTLIQKCFFRHQTTVITIEHILTNSDVVKRPTCSITHLNSPTNWQYIRHTTPYQCVTNNISIYMLDLMAVTSIKHFSNLLSFNLWSQSFPVPRSVINKDKCFHISITTIVLCVNGYLLAANWLINL